MTSLVPWGSKYKKTCPRCSTPHWTEGTCYCRECYRDRENEKAHAAGVPERASRPEIMLGEKYGAWTTIEVPPVRKGSEAWGTRRSTWLCVCDECGGERVIQASALAKSPRCPECARRGHEAKRAAREEEKEKARTQRTTEREAKKAEACRRIEEAKRTRAEARAEAALAYSKHPFYGLWRGIRDRCSNPNSGAYQNYGGRGIAVCREWDEDFTVFRDYCETHLGPRPEGMSIDRADNDGNYEPGNIRWATAKMQARNTRTNVLLTIDGKTKRFMRWTEEYGLDEVAISRARGRLWSGWEPKDALTQPSGYRSREKVLTEEQIEEVEARGLTYNLVLDRLAREWTLEEATTLPKGCIVRSDPAKPPKRLERRVRKKKIGCWFCGKSGHRASDHPEYEVYMATRKPHPS